MRTKFLIVIFLLAALIGATAFAIPVAAKPGAPTMPPQPADFDTATPTPTPIDCLQRLCPPGPVVTDTPTPTATETPQDCYCVWGPIETDTPTPTLPPGSAPRGGKVLRMPYLAPSEDIQLDVPYLLNRALSFLLAFGSLALAVLGAIALNDVRRRVTKPALHLVLDALRPFAGQAIYAAEMLAANELTRIQGDLGGADKKSIADHFYDALPDTIMVLGRAVPISIIKALVPRASWEQLVQSVFDDAEARIGRNKDWLIKEAEKWRAGVAAQKMLPADPTPKFVNGILDDMLTSVNTAFGIGGDSKTAADKFAALKLTDAERANLPKLDPNASNDSIHFDTATGLPITPSPNG